MNERFEAGLWCHEVLHLLDAFVDGGLDDERLLAVQQHCAVCSECAQFGAAYARLVATLRTAASSEFSDGQLERLRHRLQVELGP